MEALQTVKRYQKYKKLRKQELALKTLLKRTIHELNREIKVLDEMFPKVKHPKFEPAKISTEKKKRKDLDDEIEEIKRQIAALG